MRRLGLVLVMLYGCSAEPGALGACGSDDDCAAFDDGDPCTGVVRCTAAQRCALDAASVVVCDTSADTPCTASVCDPAVAACALTPRRQGLACDDGEPCTHGDRCDQGACTAGDTNLCECLATADCADDGDLCNGTPFCDTARFPHRCAVNPATVVACSPSGGPCKLATCDPKTGKCADQPLADGAACDDGEACTANDTCLSGACVGGDDTCTCKVTADCIDDDGDPCTGTPYCAKASGAGAGDAGTCKTNPATVVTCSSKADTACAKNQCHASTGSCALAPVKDETPCDDGDACTKGEVCVAGSCTAGTDTCLCTQDSDCTDDGDLCNGTPFCNKQSGKCAPNPATVVTCATATDTACAKTVCLPKSGKCAVKPRSEVTLVGCVDVVMGGVSGKQCLWKAATTTGAGPYACDDGDACTQGEVCVGQACSGGKVTCECAQDSDCAAKDDGDLCNGTQYCNKATAKCEANPASVVYCAKSQDTACLKATCDPKTGDCGLAPVAGPCDDGKPCTAATSCAKGVCQGGKATDCDDQDVCTVDACDLAKGCQHKPKTCADGNDCTLDGCDAKTGQCKVGLQPVGAPCNGDGNGCTVNDACDGKGSCLTGPPVTCSGTTPPCQALVCKSKNSADFTCTQVAVSDKTSCDAKGACELGAQCKQGKCSPGGTPRLFAKVLGTKAGYTRFVAVAPLPTQHLAIVGQHRAAATLPATENRALVRRVDGFGDTVWQQLIQGTVKHKATAALDVATTSQGDLVVGAEVGSKSGTDLMLRRISPTGDLLWSATHDAGPVDWFGSLAVGKDNATTVLASVPGTSKGKDVSRVGVWRVSAAGATLTSKLGNNRTGLLRVVGGVALGGGAVAGTLVSPPGAVASTAVLRVAANNGYSFFNSLVHVSAQPTTGHAWGGGQSVLRLADGDLVAVGWGSATTTAGKTLPRSEFTRLSAQGEARWTHVGRDQVIPLGTAHHAQGAVVMLGLDESLAQPRYRLHGLDTLGNEQWSRAWASGGPLEGGDVAFMANGDVVAVGTVVESQGGRRGVMLRADAWGHLSCSEQGACSTKGWKDCDDGKLCSADDCDSMLGCVHAPALGLRCVPNNGCSTTAHCEGSTCVPSHNGEVYVKEPQADDVFVAQPAQRFALRLHQGSLYGVGPAANGAKPAARKATLSFDLVGYASSFLGNCTGSWVDAAFDPASPPVWSLFKSSKGGADRARICRTVHMQQTQAINIATYAKSSASPVAVCRTVDGAAWVVSQVSGASVLMQLTRVDDAMKVTVNTGFPLPGCTTAEACKGALPSKVVGVAPMPDAGVVLLRQVSGPPSSGRLIRATLNGALTKVSVAWVVKLEASSDLEPLALATSSVGTTAVVGRYAPNASVFGPFHARVGADGKLQWLTLESPPLLEEADAVVHEPDGGLTWSGWRKVSGAKLPVLSRVSADGKRLWARVIDPHNPQVTPRPGVLVRGTDSYFLGAQRSNGSSTSVAIIRASLSGYASCVDAGVCAGKAPCDDSKPCTADACDAKGGCQHTPVNGGSCGVGLVCAKGACVNAP